MFDIQSLILDLPLNRGGNNRDAFTEKPKNIVVIGSSGAGKTTLINFIKNGTELVKQNHVFVPKRYITREKRLGDDLVENQHTTEENFAMLVMDNEINVHWERDLGGSKREHYGFASAVNEEGVLLYSANNAIVRPNVNLHPKQFLENSLIIGVYLPDDTRTARFGERSPDLKKDKQHEVAKRLSDSSDNILQYSDIIIDNSAPPEQVGQTFASLLKKLIYI